MVIRFIRTSFTIPRWFLKEKVIEPTTKLITTWDLSGLSETQTEFHPGHVVASPTRSVILLLSTAAFLQIFVMHVCEN